MTSSEIYQRDLDGTEGGANIDLPKKILSSPWNGDSMKTTERVDKPYLNIKDDIGYSNILNQRTTESGVEDRERRSVAVERKSNLGSDTRAKFWYIR